MVPVVWVRGCRRSWVRRGWWGRVSVPPTWEGSVPARMASSA
ncbi:hypothetical protein TMCG_01075, partial [Mycobacterium tuberculosis SUMu003]